MPSLKQADEDQKHCRDGNRYGEQHVSGSLVCRPEIALVCSSILGQGLRPASGVICRGDAAGVNGSQVASKAIHDGR